MVFMAQRVDLNLLSRDELYFELHGGYMGWFRHALSLRRAALHLEPSISKAVSALGQPDTAPAPHDDLEFIAVHSMLMGYAFENLFKGFLVWRGAPVRDPKKPHRLNSDLKTHDLSKLATKAGFGLEAREHDLLNKLFRTVEGSGRYPVQKDIYLHGRQECPATDDFVRSAKLFDELLQAVISFEKNEARRKSMQLSLRLIQLRDDLFSPEDLESLRASYGQSSDPKSKDD